MDVKLIIKSHFQKVARTLRVISVSLARVLTGVSAVTLMVVSKAKQVVKNVLASVKPDD